MSIGKINEIVGDDALAKFEKLIQDLGLANKAMAEAISLANQYNMAIGGSKTIGDYTSSAAKAKSAIEDVEKSIEKTRLAEIKLQQAREKAFDDYEKKLQKQAEAVQAATDKENAARKKQADLEDAKFAKERDAAAKKEAIIAKETKATLDSESQKAAAIEKRRRLVQESTAEEIAALARSRNGNAEVTSTITAGRSAEAAANSRAAATTNEYSQSQSVLAGRAIAAESAIVGETAATIANTTAQRSGIENIGRGLTRGLGYLRTLAYILPGIGIAGIFTLAWEGLSKLIDGLDLFKGKIVALGGLMKNLNEINKEASKEFGEQSTKLKVLYDAATDVNNSMHNRLLAALELKKEFPNTFENLTNEAILNGKSAASYRELTATILEQAVARASYEKVAKLAATKAEADFQIKKLEIATVNDITRAYKELNNVQGYGIGGSGARTSMTQKMNSSYDRNTEKIKEQQQIKESADRQIKFFTEMAGGNNKMALELSKQNAKKLNDQTIKDAKQLNNDELELQKAKLTGEKEAAKLILDNDLKSYEERYAALKAFVERSKALILIENEIADRTPGITNTRKKVNAQNASNQNAQVDNFDLNEREKIQEEINSKYLAEQKRVYDAIVSLEKAREDLITNVYNEQLLQLDYFNSERILKITQAYSDGLITEKKYNNQLRQLKKEAAQEQIDIQINALEKIAEAQSAALALGFGSGDPGALQGTANKITQLRIQSNNLKTGALTDGAKGDNLTEREKAQETLAFADQAIKALDIVGGLIQANSQAKIDALEREFELIQKNGEADKDRINNSILSSKEKARQNSIIDAQTQQQRIRITEQENDIKKKQAEFDKANAIAKIIQQTAVAVVTALTIPVYGLALATTIGALGAAQLAIALATPLPQFEKGGTVKKDGPIITGEAGPELRIDPSGRYSLTAGHENITYAKAGTKIISNKELMKMVAKPESVHYVSSGTTDNKKIEKLLAENNDLLKKQKRPIVNVHGDRWGKYSQQRNY